MTARQSGRVSWEPASRFSMETSTDRCRIAGTVLFRRGMVIERPVDHARETMRAWLEQYRSFLQSKLSEAVSSGKRVRGRPKNVRPVPKIRNKGWCHCNIATN